MATGKVKWFNDAKGLDSLPVTMVRNVFAPFGIVAEGFRSLSEGQKWRSTASRWPRDCRAANGRKG